MRCARCSKPERHNDTFLCRDCLYDPRQKVEVEVVSETTGDYRAWRRRLIADYGWFGWGRLEREGPHA